MNPTEKNIQPLVNYSRDEILPIGESVLASWIRSIVQTARGYGIDPDAFMLRSGMNVDLLTVPDARFSAVSVRRLWSLLIPAVGDNLFGLQCGLEMQVSALHGLGLSIITSHSLAQVLDLIANYAKVISTTMDTRLEHNARSSVLKVQTLHGQETFNSASLTLLALIARQARSLAQREVKPLTVWLSYDKWTPYELRCLHDYFQCPVIIDSETEDGIEFAYPDVIEPYASANALLREANETVVKNYLHKVHRNSYTVLVEQQIDVLLQECERINVKTIASNLGLSARTLQRRLRNEGVSFMDVVERYRKQLAHDALAHTELSITEISYNIGFSDLSNFSRKCYTWFGACPAEYRKRIRQLQT